MTIPVASQISAALLVIAALWLGGIGVVMALQPQRALDLLGQTAASYKANFIEQIPRLIAGIALILRAPQSRFPVGFELAGWFIAVSSVALLIIPLRWHAGYARWWAERIPHWAVRTIAPFSIAAAAGLVYATF